jgi:DnaJ-class molecular chaperone
MGHQNIWILCPTCKGEGEYSTPAYDEDGNEDGEKPVECSKCDGTGRLLWGYLET